MKVRVTMDLDIPDYPDVRQEVWEETLHRLHVYHLEALCKAHIEPNENLKQALIQHHKIWADTFKDCSYSIERLE